MVILLLFPVLLSVADTFRIPLESRSKVTSIWGTPLGAGGDAAELKFPQNIVVLGHGPFSFVHLDDSGLVVGVGRESLGGTSWDSVVSLYELGHHATCGLDTKRERSHVDQQDVLHGSLLLHDKMAAWTAAL